MLAYFISDIHLKSMEEERADQLLRFLRKIKMEEKTTHLFLLGDIFDLWLGSKKIFIQKYNSLIQEFKSLKNHGIEIHYFEGNHDIYLKDYWEKELQFFVHENPIYLNLGSLKFKLEHGDTIDRRDYAYLIWKWFIHTKGVKFLVRIIPDSWIYSFCEMLGKKSRKLSKNKRFSLEKLRMKVKMHIQRSLQKKEIDFFVAGHYHVKDDFTFSINQKKVRAFNLGTWLKQALALKVTETNQEFIEL